MRTLVKLTIKSKIVQDHPVRKYYSNSLEYAAESK
jgi:hypothetical protein